MEYPDRGSARANYDLRELEAGRQHARVLRSETGTSVGFLLFSRARAGLQVTTLFLDRGRRTRKDLRSYLGNLVATNPVFTLPDQVLGFEQSAISVILRQAGFRHITRKRLALDPRHTRSARPEPIGFHIRGIRGSDRPGIARLVTLAYRSHIDGAFGPGGDAAIWGRRYVRELFQSRADPIDYRASFVALRRARIIGDTLVTGRGKSPHFQDLAVNPSFRRMGLGSALMLRSLGVLAGRRAPRVDVAVTRQNPTMAVRLYRRLGFRRSSRDWRMPGLWINEAARKRLRLAVRE
jgi:ribosomal protein S18 acetylase RimI-like enzyme